MCGGERGREIRERGEQRERGGSVRERNRKRGSVRERQREGECAQE